jgi:hypothetical protein
MRPKLRPDPAPRPAGRGCGQAVAGERRGNLLGTQPGPVPADGGGQPSSACKFVLVALASHAGPDGTGAFPSVATLVRYTGLAERTVRTCLHRLAAAGIIAPCDPGIVAARVKRADRRPQGWDRDLSLIREDRDEDGDAPPDRPPQPATGPPLPGGQGLMSRTGCRGSLAYSARDVQPADRGAARAVRAHGGSSRAQHPGQARLFHTHRNRHLDAARCLISRTITKTCYLSAMTTGHRQRAEHPDLRPTRAVASRVLPVCKSAVPADNVVHLATTERDEASGAAPCGLLS